MTDFASFANAIFARKAPLPRGLCAWNKSDPAKRFGVYRNNVVASLIDALRANHPVCAELVGDEFFRAMAHIYVQEHKPSTRLMWLYGVDFGDFIETFGPASNVPYLADVARLEAARVSAYHAQDRAPLAAADFAALDPSRLAAMRLVLHPSARVVRSPYAIHSLWAAHQGELSIEDVDPHAPEDALVTRPAFSVETCLAPHGAADFLESLARGELLGEAALGALAKCPEFDLSVAFNLLIATGAVVSFEHDEGVLS